MFGGEQGSFKKLYKFIGVKNGHAYRRRDTLGVELLMKREPVADVAVLPCYQSVSITEKLCSPWVITRYEQFENVVRKNFLAPQFRYN